MVQTTNTNRLGLIFLILVLGLRLWSWSYTVCIVSHTVVHDKTLSEMIVLKCNKRQSCVLSYNKYRNSAKRYWSLHFDVLVMHFVLVSITHYDTVTTMISTKVSTFT